MAIFFVSGSINVNVHNEGKVPFFNFIGPKYNFVISRSVYEKVRHDYPGVIIYPVNSDPIMAKKLADRQAEKKVSAELIKPKSPVELIKPKSPVQETVKLEEKVIIEPITTKTEITVDEEIDRMLEDAPIEVEEIIQPTEEDWNEIKANQEVPDFKRYTYAEAVALTKAQLKHILNVDRCFEPGTKYYGGYHDNHDILVKYVLDSQK